jgi:hypothetical protein
MTSTPKKPRTDSNLKVAFQTAVAGAYMLVGENAVIGVQTAGYVYDNVVAAYKNLMSGPKPALR